MWLFVILGHPDWEVASEKFHIKSTEEKTWPSAETGKNTDIFHFLFNDIQSHIAAEL